MTDASISDQPPTLRRPAPPAPSASLRLPTHWLGVAPFFIFALMFLILPTLYLVIGAFQNARGRVHASRTSSR